MSCLFLMYMFTKPPPRFSLRGGCILEPYLNEISLRRGIFICCRKYPDRNCRTLLRPWKGFAGTAFGCGSLYVRKCDALRRLQLHTPDREPRLHGELAPPSRRRAPLQQSKGRDLYNWRSTGNCDYNNWRSHHAKLSGDLETGQSQLQPTNN